MNTRLVFAGGPKVGKTTRAISTGMSPILHCDTLIETLGWSEASEAISHRFDDPGPWVIEGVQTPRALRKWLARNPEGMPADIILYRNQPWQDLTKGQASMAKGVETVWNEIRNELLLRGVSIGTF